MLAGVLYIIGAAAIIVGVVSFFSGFALGFVLALVAAIVFFALANILEKQERILSLLEAKSDQGKKKLNLTGPITCQECKQSYGYDYASCPHCGFLSP